MPGSHNDINVLHRSPLFAKLAEGRAPEVNYTINGHDYTMGYYLTDGIYPSWATLVKSISQPIGNKNKYFAKAQEAKGRMSKELLGFCNQDPPLFEEQLVYKTWRHLATS